LFIHLLKVHFSEKKKDIYIAEDSSPITVIFFPSLYTVKSPTAVLIKVQLYTEKRAKAVSRKRLRIRYITCKRQCMKSKETKMRWNWCGEQHCTRTRKFQSRPLILSNKSFLLFSIPAITKTYLEILKKIEFKAFSIWVTSK